MKKWIITLLGIIVLFTAIKIGVGFFQGAFKANALGISALIPFIIFGALFVFSYFSRFHLKGGYEKIKIIVPYATSLAFIQILIYFYK
ncbi:MAG: hypothetical protein UU87_C0001G0086 [Parcubacteria group bacterium GW2011_GWA2_42_11]|nr:MAG: hypothetical protein UU87_C0001G0086 [Parcubacteria group bacterium GW2011_GWA2_42_11]